MTNANISLILTCDVTFVLNCTDFYSNKLQAYKLAYDNTENRKFKITDTSYKHSLALV